MEEQSSTLEPQIDLAPSSWPKVVGILSIVWACFGLTCIGCFAGWLSFGTALLPPNLKDAPKPPGMVMTLPIAFQLGSGFLMSLLLIAAGIQTLRRQMSGRTLHLVWALLTIPIGAIGLYISWRQQIEAEQWFSDNPDSEFAKGYRPGKGGQMVGLLIGAFMQYAWPTFCLIWFGLVKRTKESFGAPPTADYI
ncbi:MAG: hypothetical protein KF805_14480 [Phycisphaeraceae bacterium]|nr:hypothetical protein [Phycisphaeraceae bacterium]